ncbi:Serpentine Receptor, class Z [Caenorhabditis elegans]|uniref:Serpentine Receptor, class Z n=1 Tax=Caenorhabditis elegans TaxID=6239 RepID=Q9TZ00_CAEEL|nr:Serpentine Receptor, class Z [Caenorhabditis elegans]CCD64042.1 Serpentine Receptor, class Z [Caenorhabditis elegans]|eukprot:NP_500350.2 Serpentine Receptor, class Z [Caenorhabditis elegans]
MHWDLLYLEFCDGGSIYLYFISVFVFLVIYLILFPFYMYVFNYNRKQDEKTFMFPIIDHIFKMNKVAYILIVCLIICIIKTCVYFSTLPSNFQLDADEEMVDTPQLFTNLAIVASLLTLFLMNQLFHCFTFLMAVERFTIYFFPSSEKIVLKFQTYVTKHIKFAYCLLIVKDILALIYALWKHVNLKGGIDVYFIYFAFYYTIFFLPVLASFLYIPIMISIQKRAHLPSFQENEPQKFIFWQTIAATVVKIIPLYLLITLDEVELKFFIIVCIIFDLFITPLLIQVSYLGCNKRNVNALISSFKFKKFVQVLCGSDSESPTVHPQVYSISQTQL